MKALSLWQPWASLWACTSRKMYETRHWSTTRRGWLLVHAAKLNICSALDKSFGSNTGDHERMRELLIDEWGGHWAQDLPRGALVGAVYLGDVIPTEKFGPESLDAEEVLLGNFGPERYAWLKLKAVTFSRPIPWKGRQNIFEVPDDVIAGLMPEGDRA